MKSLAAILILFIAGVWAAATIATNYHYRKKVNKNNPCPKHPDEE